jgi:DNA-directed RNA polymerase specialized sigma24 family protein
VVYERSWILKIGAEQLLSLLKQQSLAVSPEQQIELDAKKQVMGDLESFDFYFSRLRSDSQLLLLLKDKHHLPYADIADALGIPVDSLKLQRQQALRTLEEWLWTSH